MSREPSRSVASGEQSIRAAHMAWVAARQQGLSDSISAIDAERRTQLAILAAGGADHRGECRIARLDGLLLVALPVGQDVELSTPGEPRRVVSVVEVDEREVIEVE